MRARLLVAGGALILAAVPAAADPYPPSGVNVVPGTVSSTSVAPGASVTFSGGGFAGRSVVRFSVDGAAIGTATATVSGSFATSVLLADPGSHVLAASGLEPGGRVRVVSVTVEVSAGNGQVAGGLPTTGTERLVPALALGLGSVATGSGLVLVARSRRRRQAA